MNLQSRKESTVSPSGFKSDEAVNPATNAGRPHSDPKAAIDRLAGAVDLYQELLRAFFSSADQSLQRIRTAAERQNAEELHRAAHQLRGVAATCGAMGVVRVSEELEQMGRLRALDGSQALCNELADEMQIARRELNSYLAPA